MSQPPENVPKPTPKKRSKAAAGKGKKQMQRPKQQPESSPATQQQPQEQQQQLVPALSDGEEVTNQPQQRERLQASSAAPKPKSESDMDNEENQATGVPDDPDNEVDDTGELISKGKRVFFHGLGPCPDPPDGETPFFKAVSLLPDLDVKFTEAADATQLFVEFCKELYRLRTDFALVFDWNDAFQDFSERPFSMWQQPEVWSSLNGVNRRFYNTATSFATNVVQDYMRDGRVARVGEFVRRSTSPAFINAKLGMFIYIWHSCNQARRFISAFHRVWQVTFECHLNAIRAPHSVIMSYRGVLVTVTAAVPLLSDDPVTPSPSCPILAYYANHLKHALGIAPNIQLPLYRGGDGRFYCLCVDELLNLSLSLPEREISFSVRYEALRYVLPKLPAKAAPFDVQQKKRAGFYQSQPVHDPGIVADIILQVGIPNAAKDLIAEACSRSTPTEPVKALDLGRDLVLPRVLRKHGINMRFLYSILTSAPFTEAAAKPRGSIEAGAAEAVKMVVYLEMLKRTIKTVLRGLMYAFPEDDEKAAANRANWLLALCGSTTNGVWRRHVFATMRYKFNTPKDFVFAYSVSLVQLLASYLEAKVGVVFDEGERRFLSFKPVLYPLGLNSTVTMFPLREVFENFTLTYNAEQERLRKLRQAAAAFNKKDNFAVRRAQAQLMKKLRKKQQQQQQQAIPPLKKNDEQDKSKEVEEGKDDEGEEEEEEEATDNAQPSAEEDAPPPAGTQKKKKKKKVMFGSAREVEAVEEEEEEPPPPPAAVAEGEKGPSVIAWSRLNAEYHVKELGRQWGELVEMPSLGGAIVSCLLRMITELFVLMPFCGGTNTPVEEKKKKKKNNASDDPVEKSTSPLLDLIVEVVEVRCAPWLADYAGHFSGQIVAQCTISGVVVDTAIALQRRKELMERRVAGKIAQSTVPLFPTHSSLLSKIVLRDNMWYVAMRYRVMGAGMQQPDLLVQAVKAIPRAVWVDRGLFRTYFEVIIEAVLGLAKHCDFAQDLKEMIMLATDYCDVVDVKYRRAQTLAAMRKATLSAVKSRNPLTSHHMRPVCELSFKWHLQRFGFKDPQTGVAIVHFLFTTLFLHAPEFTDDQEQRLALFRAGVETMGELTVQQLQVLFTSQAFLELVADMVSLMSDMQDWETAQTFVSEADKFILQQGGRPEIADEQQEEREGHTLAVADSDAAAALSSSAPDSFNIGEAVVEMVREQVARDNQMQLNVLQLQEARVRDSILRQWRPTPFPFFLRFVEAMEEIIRDQIIDEEEKLRIMCPGSMEAHLWLLSVAELRDKRMTEKAERQQDRLWAQEQAQRRRDELARQWKVAQSTIVEEQKAEEEYYFATLRLKTSEGFERRQLLEEERSAMREIRLLYTQHQAAIRRHEEVLRKLEAEEKEELDRFEDLFEHRILALLGKEDTTRSLIETGESRTFAAIRTRFSNGRLVLLRSMETQEELSAKARRAAQLEEEEEAAKVALEQKQLEELEAKIMAADEVRAQRRVIEEQRHFIKVQMAQEGYERRIAGVLSKEANHRRAIHDAEEKHWHVIAERWGRALRLEQLALIAKEEVVIAAPEPPSRREEQLEADLVARHEKAEAVRRERDAAARQLEEDREAAAAARQQMKLDALVSTEVRRRQMIIEEQARRRAVFAERWERHEYNAAMEPLTAAPPATTRDDVDRYYDRQLELDLILQEKRRRADAIRSELKAGEAEAAKQRAEELGALHRQRCEAMGLTEQRRRQMIVEEEAKRWKFITELWGRREESATIAATLPTKADEEREKAEEEKQRVSLYHQILEEELFAKQQRAEGIRRDRQVAMEIMGQQRAEELGALHRQRCEAFGTTEQRRRQMIVEEETKRWKFITDLWERREEALAQGGQQEEAVVEEAEMEKVWAKERRSLYHQMLEEELLAKQQRAEGIRRDRQLAMDIMEQQRVKAAERLANYKIDAMFVTELRRRQMIIEEQDKQRARFGTKWNHQDWGVPVPEATPAFLAAEEERRQERQERQEADLEAKQRKARAIKEEHRLAMGEIAQQGEADGSRLLASRLQALCEAEARRRHLIAADEERLAVVLRETVQYRLEMVARVAARDTEQEHELVEATIEFTERANRARLARLQAAEDALEKKIAEARAAREAAAAARKEKESLEAGMTAIAIQRALEACVAKEFSARAAILFAWEKKVVSLTGKHTRLMALATAELTAVAEAARSEATLRARREREDRIRSILIAHRAAEEVKKVGGLQRMRRDATNLRDEMVKEHLAKDEAAIAARRLMEIDAREASLRRAVCDEEAFQFDNIATAQQRAFRVVEAELQAQADTKRAREEAQARRADAKKRMELMQWQKLRDVRAKAEAAAAMKEEALQQAKGREVAVEARRKRAEARRGEREVSRSRAVQQIMIVLAQKKAERAQQQLELQLARHRAAGGEQGGGPSGAQLFANVVRAARAQSEVERLAPPPGGLLAPLRVSHSAMTKKQLEDLADELL